MRRHIADFLKGDARCALQGDTAVPLASDRLGHVVIARLCASDRYPFFSVVYPQSASD